MNHAPDEMMAMSLDRWQKSERAFKRGQERMKRLEIAACTREAQWRRLLIQSGAFDADDEENNARIAELDETVISLIVGGPSRARSVVARERRQADLLAARISADRFSKAMDEADAKYHKAAVRRYERSLGL